MAHHIRKIMVCIGFSDYSKGIYNYAAQFADAFGAELVVASVINQRDVAAVETISALGYEVDGCHYIDGIHEQRREYLSRLIDASDFPDRDPKLLFCVGKPTEELLRMILEEGVDLVVMGIKGKTRIEHALTGSVADKVFRRSPVTIVSYRPEDHARKLRKKLEP